VNIHRAYITAIASAVAFGVAAPLAKKLTGAMSPFLLSGLLYLGAGALATLVALVGKSREEPIRARDAPRLAAVIAIGGFAAPLLLMVGLARTSAMAASLLLNLEAVFTGALAASLFGERLGKRGALALATIVAGAVAVAGASGGGLSASSLGALAVAAASLCWGVDNNLTRALSARNPSHVAAWKGLAAGAAACAIGLVVDGKLPPARAIGAALAIGALGYGASLVLYVRALRDLGAARTGALFNTAPFVGALAAIPLDGERPGLLVGAGGLAMAAGVWLMVSERHDHPHVHAEEDFDETHAHLHVHDEHHQHAHDGSEGPEPHSHPHRHARLAHAHPHGDDLHHRHRH